MPSLIFSPQRYSLWVMLALHTGGHPSAGTQRLIREQGTDCPVQGICVLPGVPTPKKVTEVGFSGVRLREGDNWEVGVRAFRTLRLAPSRQKSVLSLWVRHFLEQGEGAW